MNSRSEIWNAANNPTTTNTVHHDVGIRSRHPRLGGLATLRYYYSNGFDPTKCFELYECDDTTASARTLACTTCPIIARILLVLTSAVQIIDSQSCHYVIAAISTECQVSYRVVTERNDTFTGTQGPDGGGGRSW